MQVSRRSLIGAGSTLALTAMLPARGRAADCEPPCTPDEALDKLRKGNDYFANNAKPRDYDMSDTRRRTIAVKQTPFAAILCCSDSRAAPEQVFQAGLGELFVVRNAGTTVANPQALGSLEYAVGNVCVPLIVVLGHTRCGAAEAATGIAETGKPLPGSLEGMVLPLVSAAVWTRTRRGSATWTDATTIENVFRVTDTLKDPNQPVLHPKLEDGHLKIVPAIYDLETGKVNWAPQRAS
ncbi:carbonic anhydrase [Sphingomonas sp.]|uniref:carbonic anhydrase n=1 Tax=Sphingomonas sp. TaxID=28214 RepID=UPI001B0FB7A9|nr:carbonic anhydrase [Sphingomonas sp.]MBO9711375.1 carbonic anhydrase [Sphingomonas sp.]